MLMLFHIGMLKRSPQQNLALNAIGMLQKIIDPSLNPSSLFIPYGDCCILKYQAYSCQGESEEPKQEQMGVESVSKSRETSVEDIVDGQNVSLHSDKVLRRQLLNLEFKHCLFRI